MRRIAAALMTLALTGPAAGQEVLVRYTAYIAPADLRDDHGRRLTEPWAVLARDRANVHRHAVRQFADETDPVFVTQAARADMARLLRAGSITPEAQRVLRHGGAIVHVRILDDGRSVHSIQVSTRR